MNDTNRNMDAPRSNRMGEPPPQHKGESPSSKPVYQKPRVVTWSAEEIEQTGTSLNGCVSFNEFDP